MNTLGARSYKDSRTDENGTAYKVQVQQLANRDWAEEPGMPQGTTTPASRRSFKVVPGALLPVAIRSSRRNQPASRVHRIALLCVVLALHLAAVQVASAQVVPDPPQNLTAANHPSTTFIQVTLTWETPANTGDSPITQVCYRYQQQEISPSLHWGTYSTPSCMSVPDMNKIVTGNLQAGLRHRFAVELRNSAGSSNWATVSITPGFSPTLAVQPTSVAENGAAKMVTVTATLGNRVTLLRDVPVTVSVGGGTATAGTDYTEVDDFTVTVQAGKLSAMGTFTLTPIDDEVDEGNETVEISGNGDQLRQHRKGQADDHGRRHRHAGPEVVKEGRDGDGGGGGGADSDLHGGVDLAAHRRGDGGGGL